MDSGNETEVQAETTQPVDAVVADTEVITPTPQGDDTEKEEVYIEEDEGDQEKPKSNMSQEQAYAAFRKEQEKRKRKNAELEEEKTERERLQREVEELKATVGTISRGEMPDPFEFDDKHEYYKALKKWEGETPKEAKPAESQQPVNNVANDEAEFYLYQREQELTKLLPEYDAAKKELAVTLKEKFNVDPEAVFLSLSDIAKQTNVDVAKAFLAMNKVPSLLDDLNKANNPFSMAKILEDAAGKVKTRTHKRIDAQPEPEITNTGVVNGGVEKLRQAWVKDPTQANHKAYRDAKNKVNRNE